MCNKLAEYWKVTFIPSTLFNRDKLRFTIDNNKEKVILMDRDEMFDYIM